MCLMIAMTSTYPQGSDSFLPCLLTVAALSANLLSFDVFRKEPPSFICLWSGFGNDLACPPLSLSTSTYYSPYESESGGFDLDTSLYSRVRAAAAIAAFAAVCRLIAAMLLMSASSFVLKNIRAAGGLQALSSASLLVAVAVGASTPSNDVQSSHLGDGAYLLLASCVLNGIAAFAAEMFARNAAKEAFGEEASHLMFSDEEAPDEKHME